MNWFVLYYIHIHIDTTAAIYYMLYSLLAAFFFRALPLTPNANDRVILIITQEGIISWNNEPTSQWAKQPVVADSRPRVAKTELTYCFAVGVVKEGRIRDILVETWWGYTDWTVIPVMIKGHDEYQIFNYECQGSLFNLLYCTVN